MSSSVIIPLPQSERKKIFVAIPSLHPKSLLLQSSRPPFFPSCIQILPYIYSVSQLCNSTVCGPAFVHKSLKNFTSDLAQANMIHLQYKTLPCFISSHLFFLFFFLSCCLFFYQQKHQFLWDTVSKLPARQEAACFPFSRKVIKKDTNLPTLVKCLKYFPVSSEPAPKISKFDLIFFITIRSDQKVCLHSFLISFFFSCFHIVQSLA